MAALTAIALATTAISAGLSAYGQVQQGEAAQRAAEYNNALAQQEARNRELEVAEQVKRQREQNEQAMGQVRVQLANSGALSTEGTPLTILGESSANFELGIQDMVREANLEAMAMRQQGAMGLWEGQQQKSAATIGAIATGVKGVGSVISQYDEAVYRKTMPDTFGLYSGRTKRMG
ncbi:hypothetical protein [Luteolibacter sp. LG18]|uniref:hypothetical protein n=1 Tax=Luteolibacter sp. LG18 TaxID=2819286 RepID=UPI002B2F780C|nr:hypothetical protein llg_26680 [Luteolibacter sp. LG18]